MVQLAVLAVIAVTVLFHWTMPVWTVMNKRTPLLLPPDAHKQHQEGITDPQVHATVMGIATNYNMKTHQSSTIYWMLAIFRVSRTDFSRP